MKKQRNKDRSRERKRNRDKEKFEIIFYKNQKSEKKNERK